MTLAQLGALPTDRRIEEYAVDCRGGCCKQLSRRTLLHDVSRVEDDHLIGSSHGGKSVGDDECRAIEQNFSSVSSSAASVATSRGPRSVRRAATPERSSGSALAIAKRCRCPPERRAPRSPHHRVVAVRQFSDEGVGLGRYAGANHIGLTGAGPPYAMLSATLSGNKKGSCSTILICERRLSSLSSRMSFPAKATRPCHGS